MKVIYTEYTSGNIQDSMVEHASAAIRLFRNGIANGNVLTSHARRNWKDTFARFQRMLLKVGVDPSHPTAAEVTEILAGL